MKEDDSSSVQHKNEKLKLAIKIIIKSLVNISSNVCVWLQQILLNLMHTIYNSLNNLFKYLENNKYL